MLIFTNLIEYNSTTEEGYVLYKCHYRLLMLDCWFDDTRQAYGLKKQKQSRINYTEYNDYILLPELLIITRMR